jgi:hypothetical protein
LAELRLIFRRRLIARAARSVFEDKDGPNLMEDALDAAVGSALAKVARQRYLHRHSRNRKGKSRVIFEEDLQEKPAEEEESSSGSEEKQPWLNDTEFLQKYRMSRSGFNRLVELIQDHPIFSSKFRQQAVAYQLMVWLKYAGTEGSGKNSNNNQRNTFKIGYGTSDVCRRRVTVALKSLTSQYYYWPDADQRLKIAEEMFRSHDFPHCVGIADGTLFPLAFEPETEDAPDYSGRKYGYSLSVMIICDNKRKVRHYLAGFPGSAHDNRIYKATKLVTNPGNYFSSREYLIGDSAFENSSTMVSAFKKPKGAVIAARNEKFNEKMAKLRIISEHTISVLKGWFPWLRSIRLKIKEDKSSLRNKLHMIDATIVLHNILLEWGEEERKEWLEEEDTDPIDLDDPLNSPYLDGDALNTALPAGAPKDERRTRLMYYFEEHHYLV